MGKKGRIEDSNSGREERERVRKAKSGIGAISSYILPHQTGLYTLPPSFPLLGGNRGEKKKNSQFNQFFISEIPSLELGCLDGTHLVPQ